MRTEHDIIILGGGPAGLSAALVLGRACKRVLLCDGGTPRNVAASHMQGFVTQDGTPPAEFRRSARAQMAAYPDVCAPWSCTTRSAWRERPSAF